MLQISPATVHRTVSRPLDTTGPSPDQPAPYFEVPKVLRYRRPLYILFNWSLHRDAARYRVYQQRWDALTPQQQAEIRIKRWGTPVTA